MSRRLPHFNRDSLEQSLPAAGIRHVWMKPLGGYRKKVLEESPHLALRNQSFRNYADYMLTPDFERAARELITLAEQSRTCYMCAERVCSLPSHAAVGLAGGARARGAAH